MSQYNYLTAEKLKLLKERCVKPYVETGAWSDEEVEFLLANFDNMLTVARFVKLEHILHAFDAFPVESFKFYVYGAVSGMKLMDTKQVISVMADEAISKAMRK